MIWTVPQASSLSATAIRIPDGQYAAFGMVTEGMDVVDDFLKVERTTGSDNAQSKPVTPITIVKAEMIDDDADGNHRVQFTMNF